MPWPRPALLATVVFVVACSTGPAPTTTAATTSTTVQATTGTTQPSTLDAKQVFDLVSPALAFVQSALASGSAVLIDGEKVITNAHVVWPYESARVVFPGGTELLDAQVIAWDMMADLAVIDVGGADDLPKPPDFGDGAELARGTPLFLMGYPAETERFPEPTITQGVLSRLRSWDEADLVYLQTDATIAGGQSGGALVSNRGEVIGISGLGLAEFALALSATTVLDRVERLLAGEDVAGLGDRRLPILGGGETDTRASSPHFAAEVVWIIDGRNHETVEATASSSTDLALSLVAPDGLVEASADETIQGDETISVELVLDGPYFLVVVPFAGTETTFTVGSSHPLIPFFDPDHALPLTVGETQAANGDYPGDLDWFTIDLEAGQSIIVKVTSTNIDPAVFIDLPSNLEEALASDDDGGGGVLGTDSEVEFTAEVAATYLVSVVDTTQFGPGGYLITVSEDG